MRDMRAMLYVLDDDGNVQPCSDVLAWAKWFESSDRHVGSDRIGPDHKGRYVEVSTVFLGIDHNHSGCGEPVLFETMVFGGTLSEEQERYSTREEALAGHVRMLERVKKIEGL